MNIIDYSSKGGKNLILDYIWDLPNPAKAVAFSIREEIEEHDIIALESLKTRQLRGKLYEIKFLNHRILYVLKDKNTICFLHICKKQKNKTERMTLI